MGTNRVLSGRYFQDTIDVLGGEAQIFKTPASNGIWQLKMWIPGEKQQFRKSLKTRDLNEAMRLAKTECVNIIGMTADGRKLFGSTFKDAGDAWLAFQMERVSTGRITKDRYRTLKTQIKKHIIPYIESKHTKTGKMGSLSYLDFFDYAQYRRFNTPEVREVTIRNEHTTIGSFIKWSFRQGYINFEKCEYEEIKINHVVRRDTFTIAEYEVLYKFLRKWVKETPDYKTPKSNMMPLRKKDFMRNLILVNANNCLRIGELRQLRWGMTNTYKKGDYWYTEYDLPAAICKNRKARKFISRGGEYLNRIKTFSNWVGKDDLIFCNNDDGKPISKAELYRMWGDIMRNVDIEDTDKRTLTPYSLRHYAITCRLYAGVSHYDVSKEAGTSVQFIEQHYEHYDAKKLFFNALKDFKVDKHGMIERIERNHGSSNYADRHTGGQRHT